jgi:hypothetical protein
MKTKFGVLVLGGFFLLSAVGSAFAGKNGPPPPPKPQPPKCTPASSPGCS